jgi:hypothetical protein
MPTKKEAPLPHKPIADVNHLITGWWGSIQLGSAIPVKNPSNFPGKIPVFWSEYAQTIRQFIESNDLHSTEEAAAKLKTISEQKPLLELLLTWNNPAGGWPGCHLHFEGKMYPLTVDQWNSFSQSALSSMKQKLEKPGTVSFEGFAAVSKAMEGIAAR